MNKKMEKFLVQSAIDKKENWEIVKIDGNYTGYKISDQGNVISMYGKMLKPSIDTSGYRHVRIWYKRKDYPKKVHRLVAEAFIPNPENKPEVNHIDGNKLNNCVSNLEWVTHEENIHHAYFAGLMEVKYGQDASRAKYTDKQIHEVCRLLEENKLNGVEISNKTNVSIHVINNIRSGNSWGIVRMNYNIPKRANKLDDSSKRIIEELYNDSNIKNRNIYNLMITKYGCKSSYTTIANFIKTLGERSTTIDQRMIYEKYGINRQ